MGSILKILTGVTFASPQRVVYFFNEYTKSFIVRNKIKLLNNLRALS
jgi:hypothetical protein